ncbi:MAG: ArsR/SmtB family transcription factor [Candidatus Heimdallarchaeota archaeon]
MDNKSASYCELESSLQRAQDLGLYQQEHEISAEIDNLNNRKRRSTSKKRTARLKKLSLMFKALSSPRRLEFLSLLCEKERCACEIQHVLGVSNPSISQHLRILTTAGLVSTEKRAQYTFVRLEPDALKLLLENFGKLVFEGC